MPWHHGWGISRVAHRQVSVWGRVLRLQVQKVGILRVAPPILFVITPVGPTLVWFSGGRLTWQLGSQEQPGFWKFHWSRWISSKIGWPEKFARNVIQKAEDIGCCLGLVLENAALHCCLLDQWVSKDSETVDIRRSFFFGIYTWVCLKIVYP